MSEDALLSLDDAMSIGMKVAEMADRVKIGHACAPGAEARWAFEMDDTRFHVVVTVAPPTSAGQSGEGEGDRGPH